MICREQLVQFSNSLFIQFPQLCSDVRELHVPRGAVKGVTGSWGTGPGPPITGPIGSQALTEVLFVEIGGIIPPIMVCYRG
jgi:hypothetical protein